MGRYVARRLLLTIPVLIGASFLIFTLVYGLPGDPIRALAGDRSLAPAVLDQLREDYHLNDPFLVQYAKYAAGLLQGDFGTDFSGRPVLDTISQRFPTTVKLTAVAVTFEAVIGLMAGIQKALKAAGAQAKIIAPRLGTLKTTQGHDVKIDWSFLTAGSVLFDAVFVPGGDKSLKTLTAEPRAVEFVAEAYKHCKAIGTTGKGMALLQAAGVSTNDREPTRKGRKPSGPEGVVIGKDADMNGVAGKFIHAVAQHRHWGRERQE